MRAVPESTAEIDEALGHLGSRVAERLQASGWTRRTVGEHDLATLTRPTPGGTLVIASVVARIARWPYRWPIAIEASLGAGVGAVLDLSPLLTLAPLATLVEDPDHGRVHPFRARLGGPDGSAGVDAVAEQLARAVDDHATAVAGRFPDAAAIDARLRPRAGEGRGFERDAQARLVLLAVTGRGDEARAQLAAHALVSAADRRFARQLMRWLDAGGPTPPPAEDTLALLPRRPGPPRPVWSDVRSQARARREARTAVRRRSRGKDPDELEALIATEYGRRGLDAPAAGVEVLARMLHLAQQPFGRIRSGAQATRMLESAGADVRRTESAEDAPAWLRAPDRAAYPVPATRGRFTVVEPDPAAAPVFERAVAEAPRRLGPFTLVEAWLTHEAPDRLAVHLGDARVGHVTADACPAYEGVLRAAALFDEDPLVRGRLSAPAGGAIRFEVRLPDDNSPPGSGRFAVMTSREDDEVAQAPATWENEVVGEAKEALGRLTRDEALVEEGEQQVEAAREVREEYQKEHEQRDER